MKALIVAAHPDDEVLGCGGTTERLKREGHETENLILGGGRGTNVDNQFDKMPLLWVVKQVEIKIEDYKPDIIFTHYEKDLNIDHSVELRISKEYISFTQQSGCGRAAVITA